MRAAKLEDLRRRSINKVYYNKVISVLFENHSTFISGKHMSFSNPTIIVGKNGSGKSRLAKIIEGVLSINPDHLYDNQDHFYIRLDYELRGSSFSNSIYRYHQGRTRTSGKAVDSVIYLNPAETANLHLDWVKHEVNLHELIDQYDPYVFSEQDLKLVSLCIGKPYRNVEAYYLDDLERPVIYFAVDDGKRIYGTESMGTGELCILTMFFQLKASNKGSFVVLEEPENFATYSSQVFIMPIIHNFMLKNDNFFIITTHSAAIMRFVNRQNIILLFERDGLIDWELGPSDRLIRDIVGVHPSKTLTLCVEDEFASRLLNKAISVVSADLLGSVKIIVLGSESNLNMLSQSNFLTQGQDVLLCYDGDCRGRVETTDKIIILPGDYAPEIEVLNIVDNYKHDFCSAYRIKHTDFLIALEQARALDHHDRIQKISQVLGIDANTLSDQLCEFYAKKNRSIIESHIVSRLKDAISAALI